MNKKLLKVEKIISLQNSNARTNEVFCPYSIRHIMIIIIGLVIEQYKSSYYQFNYFYAVIKAYWCNYTIVIKSLNVA